VEAHVTVWHYGLLVVHARKEERSKKQYHCYFFTNIMPLRIKTEMKRITNAEAGEATTWKVQCMADLAE